MSVTKYTVNMTCGGCKKGIEEVLGDVDGITKVECDVEGKTVTVTHSCDQKAVTDALTEWTEEVDKEAPKIVA